MARGSRILVRYLLSSVLLALVPLTVFSLFLFHYVSDLLVDSAIAEAEGQLEVLQTAVDRELLRVADTALKIGLSQRLRPFRVREQPGSAYVAVQALGEFRQPTSVVSEIFLYFHSDDFLLCASSTVGIDRLDVIVDGADDADASDLLGQITRPVLRLHVTGPYRTRIFSSAPDDFFLVRYPVPSWSPVPYATLTFALSASRMLSLAPTTGSGINFAIVTPDGTVAASSGALASVDAARVHAVHQPGRVERRETADGRVVVVDRVSPETGWTFYALADLEAITAPADRLRRTTMYVIAGLAALLAVLVLVVMRINYRPVRSLLDTLSVAHPSGGAIDTFSEARVALGELIHAERSLTRRVEREAGQVREGVVNQILAGMPVSAVDLESVWIGGAPATGARFVALAVRPGLSGPGAAGGSRRLVALATEISDDPAAPCTSRWLIRAGAQREPVVAIVQLGVREGSADEAARWVAGKALAAVRFNESPVTGKGAVVGVGTVVSSLDELPRSYKDARRALDQAFVQGNDRVIILDEAEPGRWDLVPAAFDPHALRQAVLSERDGGPARYLTDVGGAMRAGRVPAYIARGLCVEICRAVADLLIELGRPPADRPEWSCARRVEAYETYDEFAEDVAQVLEQIGSYQRSRHDREAVRLVERLKHEIDLELADPQFSIQSLAERHNLSPSSLSTLFRRHAGTGANAYLTTRRIEAARELLRTTDLPLKEIAVRVGYYNVSSFIRRYRALTGETPGDYRAGA